MPWPQECGATPPCPAPCCCLQAVRDKLCAWVRDTYNHITSVTELSVELQQLRHALACVARQCSLQLADGMPQVGTHCRGQAFGDGALPLPGGSLVHVAGCASSLAWVGGCAPSKINVALHASRGWRSSEVGTGGHAQP